MTLPYITFLRKCVKIKQALIVMGDSDFEVKIRNLPVGSDNYYICYLIEPHVQPVFVERDSSGNIIAVHDKLLYDWFQDGVDDYIAAQTDPEAAMFGLDSYPIAEPMTLDIYAYSDEKIDFIPTKSYLTKVKKAQAALKELENEEGKIFLDHHLVQQWVAKHRAFYWSIQLDWNMKKLKVFQQRFDSMNWLNKDIGFYSRIKKALAAYKPLDEDWVWKASKLGGRLYGCDIWLFEIFDERPFMIKEIGREFYLYGEVYQSIFNFATIYTREKEYFSRDEMTF
jgi:hypothetical protein